MTMIDPQLVAAAAIRVFIVDDHPTVREGLAQIISQHEDLVVCGCADDSDSALSEVAAGKIDVMIVDMGLKRSSGLELIKRLHEVDPQVAVVAWSMHEASLFGRRAIKAGALGYVSKSQPTSDVIAAIRDVGRRSSTVVDEPAETIVKQRRKSSAAGTNELPSVEDLSDRELQVFQMLGQGLNMAQIVDQTQLSPKTIETYRARIKQKLNLANHAELLRHAIHWALERKP